MTPELWLTLMSVALVLPVMIVLLYVTFSGRLGRTEDARHLPMLGPEHDFWDGEDEDAHQERGREP